jgi:hypothetical protein
MSATGDSVGIAPGSAARLGAARLSATSASAVDLIHERLLDEIRTGERCEDVPAQVTEMTRG